MKSKIVKKIAIIASFTALSYVLYLVKFNLPFIFPSFLEIQFSNLPLFIVSFALGPIEGMALAVVRFFLKLPLTSTAGVGEIADLIIGLSCALISGFVYRKSKTKKGAVVALLFSSLAWIIVAIVLNWLVLTPLYVQIYFNGDLSIFIGACSIIPGINESNYMIRYLLIAILPFNIVLSSLVSILTFIVYKKVSFFIKRYI